MPSAAPQPAGTGELDQPLPLWGPSHATTPQMQPTHRGPAKHT